MLIEAGENFYKFNPAKNIFQTSIDLNIAITNFETNDSRLNDWVSSDGGIVFCKAAYSPNIRPRDTS